MKKYMPVLFVFTLLITLLGFNVNTASAVSSITVLSPNGGETWTQGQSNKISWTSQGLSKVFAYLVPANSTGGGSGSLGIIGSVSSSFSNIIWDGKKVQSDLNSNTSIAVPPGNYKIYLVGNVANVNNQTVDDMSNSYFTITLPNYKVVSKTVSGPIDKTINISCDPGDTRVSGGVTFSPSGDSISKSSTSTSQSCKVHLGSGEQATCYVSCKDSLPQHGVVIPTIISLGTNNALPGEKVAMYISGFPKAYSYSVDFNGQNMSGEAMTSISSNGTFLSFAVPDFPAGSYSLKAEGHNLDGSFVFGTQNSVPFTIGTPQPSSFSVSAVPNGINNSYDYEISSSKSFDEIVFRASCSDSEVTILAKGVMFCNVDNHIKFASTTSYSQPITYTSNDGKNHTVYMIVTAYANSIAISGSQSHYDSVNVPTVLAPSITLISKNITVTSNDGINSQATGVFKFKVDSGSNDIYVSRTNPQGLVQVINISNGNIGNPKSAVLTATSPSTTTGSDTEDYFRIKAGENRTFDLTFFIEPTKGSGFYKAQATSLVTEKGNLVKFGDEFTTNYVFLTGSVATPSITVTSPNGGQTFTTGSNMLIQWSSHNAPSSVGINLFQNNNLVQAISNAPNNGSYTWLIPSDLSGSNYKIRIYGEGDFDESDSSFTITAPSTPPSITVLSPNGGEAFTTDSNNQINFTLKVKMPTDKRYAFIAYLIPSADTPYNNANNLDNVRGYPIGGAENGYQNRNEIFQSSWAGSVGVSGKYKLRVYMAPYSGGAYPTLSSATASDESDNYFTVTTPTPPSIISITNPTQDNNKMSVTGVRLNDSTAFGFPTVYIDGNIVSGVDGSKDGTVVFFVPPALSNGYHSLYVKNANGVSNIMQFMYGTSPKITITSPNGGEMLTVGQTYRIMWNSDSKVDKVTIGYSSCASCLDWIANNIPNTNYYDWTVGVGNTTNTKFKIYVLGYQTGTGSWKDYSDSDFTITAPTQSLTASSAEIIGSQSTYISGQAIKFGVKGIVSDGSIGLPSKGFNVQAWMRTTKETVQVNGVYQSFNATYNPNTSLWDVAMTAPSDSSKTYEIEAAFYCGNSQLGCSDGQISESFTFTVTNLPNYKISKILKGPDLPGVGQTAKVSCDSGDTRVNGGMVGGDNLGQSFDNVSQTCKVHLGLGEQATCSVECKDIPPQHGTVPLTANAINTMTDTSSTENIAGNEKFYFTQFLSEGSHGNEVTELQKSLNEAGYDAGKLDGIFGPKTKEALTKFQIANGLKSDGIAGFEVRSFLNK